MRKTGICFMILGVILLNTHAFAQRQKIIWAKEPGGLKIKTSDREHIDLTFSLSGFNVEKEITPGGSFERIRINGFAHSSIPGLPELPVLNKLIEIPGGTTPLIHVVSLKTKNISLKGYGFQNPVYPVQPSVSKRVQQNRQKFFYQRLQYQKDTLFGEEPVHLKSSGITRGRKLSVLTIAPLRYNPLKNELNVITRLEVTIEFKPDKTAGGQTYAKYNTKSFEPVFNKVLNSLAQDILSFSNQAIKYVILSDSSFRDALQPLIRWKTRKGYKVIEVYKGDPGVGTTAEEMKAYLNNLYHSATPEDPAFSYLLIVGDDEQIPAFRAGHITDLYYAEYDGNGDFVPDVFYGRFSAKDTSELNPQIEKTLEYEQYLFPDPSFLNEAVMIAGVDGSYASKWGNGQINYGTRYYFNTSHGINSHTYLYPESGSSDAQIIQDISNGAGFVNYTGHGEWNRWIDPAFSISNIDSLKNKHKYPLMIGNGCVTTVFDYDNCLGEALLKARDKGALGYIGCSNDSYWDEDFWWAVGAGLISANPAYEETNPGMYDLAFHEHGEPEDQWALTQDQFIFSGNMAVTESNSSRTKYYWEIYHLMGDPSLSIYFSVPDSIPATYSTVLPLGSTRFQIFTLPHIYAGLSRNDTLIAGGFSNDDGLVNLVFPALKDTGKLSLVLTGQNRIPLIKQVDAGSYDQPFVILDTLVLDDQMGNNNLSADYGEDLFANVTLKNFGAEEARDVIGRLSTLSPYLVLIDSTEIWDTIRGGESKLMLHAFRFKVNDSISDRTVVTLKLQTTDQLGSKFTSYYSLFLNAPELGIGRMKINDNLYGNGNTRLDPGEKAEVNAVFNNRGHSKATHLNGMLQCTDSLINLLEDSIQITELDSMSEFSASFMIQVDSTIPRGKLDYLSFRLSDSIYQAIDSFPISIGLVYEDFETGDFNLFHWIKDDLHPWQVTEDKVFEGYFSARSGLISNNNSSPLSIQMYIPESDSISFQYKVSSEADYDYLKFLVDDTLKAKWSGEKGWSEARFPIRKGEHTLKWVYAKDESVSKGFDRAWIDFIVFPKNSFFRFNAGIASVIRPVTGLGLTDSEEAEIELFNYGTDTIYSLPVGFYLDGDTVTESISEPILPGEKYRYIFSSLLDLSQPGDYVLTFFTALPSDEVLINDTITLTVRHLVQDAGISRILSPVSDSVFSDSEIIKAVLHNFGTNTLSGIPVVYRVNGGIEISEISDTLLLPGDSLIYVFNTTSDLSAYDTCLITVFINLPNDYNRENDTSRLQIERLGSSGIVQYKQIPGLSIFPNPTNGQINLIFNNSAKELRYRIQYLSGKITLQRNLPVVNEGRNVTIDMVDLPAGMYLLIVESGNQRSVFKIIKQ